MNTYGLNQEGYLDPTATQAVAAATKVEKKYLSLVYICSKYSGDTIANIKATKQYRRFAVDQGAIPLAPHLLLPLYIKEESERELAMFMDMLDGWKLWRRKCLPESGGTARTERRDCRLRDMIMGQCREK